MERGLTPPLLSHPPILPPAAACKNLLKPLFKHWKKAVHVNVPFGTGIYKESMRSCVINISKLVLLGQNCFSLIIHKRILDSGIFILLLTSASTIKCSKPVTVPSSLVLVLPFNKKCSRVTHMFHSPHNLFKLCTAAHQSTSSTLKNSSGYKINMNRD